MHRIHAERPIAASTEGNAMKTLTPTVLALALLVPFAVARAGVMPPPTPLPDATAASSPSFDELDRNNDGVLTQDEVPAGHELSSVFARYDRDGDLSINRSEFDLYMSGDDDALAADDEDEDEDDEER
jgi:hypothetical protein